MKPQPLDPLTLPLAGMNLIEASAGTGKTYNIAALFARLVLVEQMPVARILVVTFTKAATAELKTRLRAQLGQALAWLRNENGATADATLLAVIRHAQQHESTARLILRLQAALNQFDGAAIHTIHGFCQRVLTDYAFLCRSPFDTETADADPLLLLTLAQDFWRRHISNHPQHAPLAAAAKLTPQGLLAELGPWLTRSDVGFRQPEGQDLAAAQAQLTQCWAKVKNQQPHFADILARHQTKLHKTYFGAQPMAEFFGELAQAVQADNPVFAFKPVQRTLDGASHTRTRFDDFDAAFIHSKTAAKYAGQIDEADILALAPLADFGAALANFQAAQNHTLLQLKLDAFAHVRQQLAAHRQNSRQRSFDDLLGDVGTALSAANPQAGALAQALADQWHIALIDEFQDTDPLQYRIFKTAFADQGRPLLMVGDPKQAIYRFRGADIHAYLQAAADTPPAQRHTLTTNHRSHHALVAGIGHVFGLKNRPFVLEGIPYTPVTAQRAHSTLSPRSAAIHIRWLHDATEQDDKGREILPNKDLLRQRAANWCADEIAAALNQGHTGCLQLGVRGVDAGDVAVLVRTHNEGALMAQALRKRGVASVSLANQSVFAGPEALALAALLAFWLRPQQGGTLRYVLGGVLFQYGAEQLQALNGNEQALSRWMDWAQQARDCWQQHGIYSALQAFARHSGLEAGLLQRRQDRSLTNFWQLAELLAVAAVDHPSPAALHQWLQQHISKPGNRGEEQQLRLESDEALVKIVTMHAAKGLEYPLVYCPFAWDGKDQSKDDWTLLHRHGQAELVHKDLLQPDDEAEINNDAMGELLRLYYVALTRAKEKLVLYAAACGNTADNPFGYLLAGDSNSSVADARAFWSAHKTDRISTLAERWQTLCHNSDDGCFAWHSGAPAAANAATPALPAQPYQALRLPERQFEFVRHTSFTALSRHRHADGDEALAPHIDHAEAAGNAFRQPEIEPETALLGFARGMQAGVCLHALLEETDFSQPAAAQCHIYPPLLARHGFADTPAVQMLPMIDAVRQARLWPDGCLADIPVGQRLAEMGFVLHMRDFGLASLRQWFAQPHLGLPASCVQAAHNLDFATVNGFLNGFIDLVCQDGQGRVAVIDYKSNHLGPRLADYHPAAMDSAVAEHHYYLQALIYAVAVARWLQCRQALPDTIAVRYLFLRGLNADNGHGIWRWDIASADLAPWLTADNGGQTESNPGLNK